MAYTANFKYDIFISYAHTDNHAPEGKHGWVDYFHEELESWLVRRFGFGKIEIWRDHNLHGNTIFNKKIKDNIYSSALFLALTSHNYLKSNYCLKELKWFYNEAQNSSYGLSIEGELRLLNILLKNINYTKWPKELHGTIGFPMHDAPANSKESGECTDPRDRRFNRQLRKVVDAIETTLKAFPCNKSEKTTEEPQNGKLQIFFADVADSMQTTRERLIADLKGSAVNVLSDIPPPMKNSDHEINVTKAICEAGLSIHLLDALPGRKIYDSKRTTYPRRQVEIGLKSKTQQIIWVPQNLDPQKIEDNAHAKLLTSLENDKRLKRNYEFIRSDKTALSDLILRKVKLMQKEKQSQVRPHTILLDTHQKDQRFAFQLADYLSRAGLNIVFNQESLNPGLSLNNFEQSLKHVNSLVIVFGRVTPNWVLARLKKTIQIVAGQYVEKNKANLENCWIYLLPSSKRTKEFRKLPGLFKINYLDNRHSETFDPKVVKPLLNIGGGRKSIKQ